MKAGGEGQEGQDGEGERAEVGGAAGRPHHEGRHQAQAAQAGHHQGHHHPPREPAATEIPCPAGRNLGHILPMGPDGIFVTSLEAWK